MIRRQHVFLLVVLLASLIPFWIPTWHFSLGLVDESDPPMVFELTAISLVLDTSSGSGLFSFEALKPKFWYINTIGHALLFIVSLVGLFHFNVKGTLAELTVQSRWCWLAMMGIGAIAGFTALQVYQINRHFEPLLGSVANPLGVAANNGLFLLSSPTPAFFIVIGVAFLAVAGAIISVQMDIRRIQASSRIR